MVINSSKEINLHIRRRSIFQWHTKALQLFCLTLFLASGFLSHKVAFANGDESVPPEWAYDPGPLAGTPMGDELLQIKASIPYFPEVSGEVMNRREVGGSSKFRPAYADIDWRMLQIPNSVKILFIGQDGTHIAEAAGRPATAGFGGRAHDLANYFGVDYSAAFINTYAFTIKGQGSSRNTPIFKDEKVQFANVVNNGLWLTSQSLESPIVQWRNRLIDWIIRNNQDSLKMIVAFGGTARDTIATFARSKGAEVGSRYSDDDLKTLQVAETQLKHAGGNNQFPVPLTNQGKDLYAQLLDQKKVNYSSSDQQQAAMKALRTAMSSEESRGQVLEEVFLTGGGVQGSGVLNPAQIGGYDLDKIVIDENQTRSLKGILLDDGSKLDSDVLIVQLPHPTYLSSRERELRLSGEDGAGFVSGLVGKAVKVLEPYANKGWRIEPDILRPELQGKGLFFGRKSRGKRQTYTYGRADIGPEYYDFGTPENRMVSVSSAKRIGVKSPGDGRNKGSVILFGERNTPKGYDASVIQNMMVELPNEWPHQSDVWTSRPRRPESLTNFDPGPGEFFAQMMKTHLDLDGIFKTKSGKSVRAGYKAHGIDDFNTMSHPDAGDFGHYRGTFDQPQVLVLADPDGYDSLMTARASTGLRGQFLHGLIKNIKTGSALVNDDYLVLQTVPFGMDGASKEEWDEILKQTQSYREALLKNLVTDSSAPPLLILADGPYATREVQRILGEELKKNEASPKFVSIEKEGVGNDSGIVEAGIAIDNLGFQRHRKVIYSSNIPRSHLSYYARTWEGTTGDRVVTFQGSGQGKAFFMVAPDWAVDQNPTIAPWEKKGIRALQNTLKENGLPGPKESIAQFTKRKQQEGLKAKKCLLLAK